MGVRIPKREHLTPDDKALRRAVIDDFCARNRIVRHPPPCLDGSTDDLARLLAGIPRGLWSAALFDRRGRRIPD